MTERNGSGSDRDSGRLDALDIATAFLYFSLAINMCRAINSATQATVLQQMQKDWNDFAKPFVVEHSISEGTPKIPY